VGITISDLKLYYRAIMIKTSWYCYRDRLVDQWNRIEDPEIKLHTYGHLIFDKDTKNIQWNKASIFNKWCWSSWLSVCRRMKLELYFSPCTKLKSKWNNDLNIKPDTLNLVEEKVGKSMELIGMVENVLNRAPMAHAQRSSIDKWDPMKLERFCKAKDIVNKSNQQPSDWENTFTNPTFDRGLISKIYKELKKLITKNPNNPIKKWGIELNQEFTTEKSQMAEKHLKKCSKSLVTREMQIKMTLRFHLTIIRMAKIKTLGDNTCWRGYGERGTLLHCWWDFKLVQPLWKSICRFLRKLETNLPEDPVIPVLGIYPKDALKGHMFHYVHSSLICDNQKLETTKMSHNRRVDTENVVHLHSRILLSY
jgi:hypothetical protein